MTEKTASHRCFRLLKWFALFLLLPLAGLIFLLGTEAGFQFFIRTAHQLAKPYFSVAQAEGRFIDQWRIGKVRVQIKNAVDIQVEELKFAWNPTSLFSSRELHVRQIAARGLTVRLEESGGGEKEEKEQKRIVLPEIRLPLGLRLDELHLTKSKIVAADGKDALLIHELFVQATARADQGEITQLKANTSQFGCDVRGKIQLSGAWPMQAKGSWSVPDHGINELRGTVEAQGDFAKVAVNATMTAPAKVTLKGQVTDILNELHWQAAAETGHFQLRDINVNVPLDGSLRIVSAAGTVKNYSGVLAADIHHEGYPPIKAEAKVKAVDYSGLNVEYLTVRHENSALTLQGNIHWLGDFSWQATLASKDVNPALVAADWPGKISGQLRSSGTLAVGQQKLEINVDGIQGELRGQPFKLGGKLALADKKLKVDELTLESGVANAHLSGTADAAQNINLAMQAEINDLSAFAQEAGGSVRLDGTAIGSADRPVIKLNLSGSQLKFQQQHLARLELQAHAALEDTHRLLVHDVQAIIEGKSALNLQGTVDWQNGLNWQAELKAAELDPGLFASAWPGAINAELRSHGSKTGDTLLAEVRIDKLQGKLRGFPFTGSGAAKIDGKTLAVEGLRLQSDSTFAQISGQADLDKEIAVTFKAGSDDLAHLAPQAGGRFQLEGTLSGTPQQPGITLAASASKLHFQEYSLNGLKAAIKADLSPSGQVDGEIKADGMQIKQETLKTARLLFKGKAEQHRVDFAVEGKPGELRLTAKGGWKEQKWQGQLAEVQLKNQQIGTWQTEKAADLLVSAESCALSGFALVHDQVRAAVSGKWAQDRGWQAQSQIDHLSLDLLRTWLPKNFPEIHGEVALTAAAQGQGAIPQQAELTLSLPELALTAENYDDADQKTTWRWQKNHLEAHLNNDTLHLTAQTHFQDGSAATFEATANNCGTFNKLEQIPLLGQLQINIMDIAPLTQLTGYAVQTQGGFGGTVDLRGTAAQPKLDGILALKKGAIAEGKIHVPAAGINLHQLQVAVVGDGHNNQLNMTAASNTGSIQVSGEISRTQEQPIVAEFTVKGENFQAVNLPEYQIWVSPTLRLVYSGKGTALTGKIIVPKARIAPLGFSGAAVSSKDVVVIDNGEQLPENSLPFSAAVAVELGQEVVVDAFGLKGFLDGGLKINAKPEQIVTAVGTLSLRDTSVAFEGVALQLNEGRIFYQGGPIDNPGLDIRASRKVNKVEAGIHLTGSADDMDIKLFSDTPMEDSEILSWLLSGQNGVSSSKGNAALSPAAAALSKVGGGALLKTVNPLAAIDMEDFVDVSIGGGKEASDVSLVMGKEIYKDLYISYGKDLTGEGGSFKARYDLKYGFSVESESTSKTTGADLIWSLER